MNAQDLPIGSTTTTEELIVQYLDGELVRRELEMVLFERLAKSDEARTLLREHLVIRGAIRDSADDERFQLSADLDDRTRSRIEEVLKALPTQTSTGTTLPDAEPLRVDPTRRRLQRWTVRPAYAALLLLFAVGATWFVTRTSTKPTATDVAANSTAVIPAPAAVTPTTTSESSTSAETPKVIVKERIVEKPVVRYVTVAAKQQTSDLAANSAPQSTPPMSVEPKEQSESNGAAIMASQRFAKLLNETAKKEVVVTTHDRL